MNPCSFRYRITRLDVEMVGTAPTRPVLQGLAPAFRHPRDQPRPVERVVLQDEGEWRRFCCASALLERGSPVVLPFFRNVFAHFDRDGRESSRFLGDSKQGQTNFFG